MSVYTSARVSGHWRTRPKRHPVRTTTTTWLLKHGRQGRVQVALACVHSMPPSPPFFFSRSLPSGPPRYHHARARVNTKKAMPP